MAICRETGRGGVFDTLHCADDDVSEEMQMYLRYRGDLEDIKREDYKKAHKPSKELVCFLEDYHERDMQKVRERRESNMAINIDRIDEYQDLCLMLSLAPRHPSVAQMPKLIDEMMLVARKTPGSTYYFAG